MGIQIYGTNKCFDTKKAERFFKERNIKYQRIDLIKYGISRGELESVKRSVGGLENLINTNSKDKNAVLIRYLADNSAKEEKLLENPQLFVTPIVRNGKQATVGYKPEIWKTWITE